MTRRPLQRFSITLLAVSLLYCHSASAFDIDGTKWFGAQATFYVDMEGVSATQISWNTAFIEAMDDWNEQTLFDFSLVQENFDPCLDNGFSSVDFSEDFCGTEFGANVLAVTLRRFEQQILGPPLIREADIVVNQEEEFNVFDGDIVQFGLAGLDFRRVALHELGHVIGLGHEFTEEAIMAPSIGDVFQLQDDDIAGVKALYTGLTNCAVNSLVFGEVSQALNEGDCTVQDLTLGGGDDSLLDLYQFKLSDTTDLTFSASSSILDVVLILATTELEYLDVDSESPEDCNSTLEASLGPGDYLLIVNTFDQPIKDDCGVLGNYQLVSQFSSGAEPFLGGNTSTLGTFNLSRFTGGITADSGATFSNVFSANDSLDISAEIRVDLRHRGQPGFLVVAALVEDQILMLNPQAEFVDVTASPIPALRFVSKVLETFEPITVATDLIPAALGIEELEADIVVGYGLDSNPGDIFYHQVPLNLTIRPDS